MTDEKKELSNTISPDTTNLKSWKKALQDTIWINNKHEKLANNQIPPYLEKREKELIEKRNPKR